MESLTTALSKLYNNVMRDVLDFVKNSIEPIEEQVETLAADLSSQWNQNLIHSRPQPPPVSLPPLPMLPLSILSPTPTAQTPPQDRPSTQKISAQQASNYLQFLTNQNKPPFPSTLPSSVDPQTQPQQEKNPFSNMIANNPHLPIIPNISFFPRLPTQPGVQKGHSEPTHLPIPIPASTIQALLHQSSQTNVFPKPTTFTFPHTAFPPNSHYEQPQTTISESTVDPTLDFDSDDEQFGTFKPTLILNHDYLTDPRSAVFQTNAQAQQTTETLQKMLPGPKQRAITHTATPPLTADAEVEEDLDVIETIEDMNDILSEDEEDGTGDTFILAQYVGMTDGKKRSKFLLKHGVVHTTSGEFFFYECTAQFYSLEND
ncbi:hypothetical protein BLNAU_11333 [Blattamonas nauphoetae]|uniref:Uncharacterized protein n=1 Tax=Blattamonas nauphoetae TaxID=2049346 RepID=A0ABQ9XP17_9EUKA|nr:hypothetical protein BLNAU_11333 [Blattamonas nauphoetae]